MFFFPIIADSLNVLQPILHFFFIFLITHMPGMFQLDTKQEQIKIGKITYHLNRNYTNRENITRSKISGKQILKHGKYNHHLPATPSLLLRPEHPLFKISAHEINIINRICRQEIPGELPCRRKLFNIGAEKARASLVAAKRWGNRGRSCEIS